LKFRLALLPVILIGKKSCPYRPWRTGPDNRNPAERYLATWSWKARSLQWVELRTTDVVEILQRTQEAEQKKAPRSNSAKRQKFVADYIAGEKAAGKRPTQAGLEEAAVAAGMRGARGELRATFKRLVEADVRRGRPRKLPPESAEK
jgi:hypothetical protein